MTLKHVKGDLFAAGEQVIAHGCNCQGFMGAGVAAIVRDKFPNAFLEYRLACVGGQFYPGVAQPTLSLDDYDEMTMVYNLATQNQPGANAKLEYVLAAFGNMKRHMDHVGNRGIAMPKIGAGIGGLRWEEVEELLVAVFDTKHDAYDVRVYSL